MEHKVAVVLGGTSPHVELIRQLKQRGFRVCLIDYLPAPPGAAVADEHVQASTLDPDRVAEIAAEKQASLVISACIDQANSTCCYVAEKLGLPHPYSYETSLDVTNKGRMKRIFAENDIPSSPYLTFTDAEGADFTPLHFPVVVKPVDCNSSKGVYRADTKEEALHCLRGALSLSRTATAIVEEFNVGSEIQVDCFATEDGARVVMTRQKKKIPGDGTSVLQSAGSVVPAPLSPPLNWRAAEIANKIARAFHLRNTPFFYQAIVTDRGIRVLEFAPRVGGGLSYYLIKAVTGFDPVAAAISSFLGEPVHLSPETNEGCFATSLLYVTPGVFDRIEGAQALKDEGVIQDYFVMKHSGEVIDRDMRSGNRVGAFVVRAEDYAGVREKERRALSALRVLSADGADILNRTVFDLKE